MTQPTSNFSGTTAVNLSRLPFPALVEILSVETLIAESKAMLVAFMAEEDPAAAEDLQSALTLESEPLVKQIQVMATQALWLRQRVNDAAKGVMIAYAVGSDLDHLAAPFGVERLELAPAVPAQGQPATMESDEALRRRVLLAPEAFSVAGPEGAYVSLTLAASGQVLDASATSPAPGQVRVTVLARSEDGVASPALLAEVEAAVAANDRRPLGDQVSVASAEILTFTIEAEITTFAGPDTAVVLAEANARLDAWLASTFRLGRDITRSGLITALSPEGVQNVNLISPATDLAVSRLQAARCTGSSVTHLGFGE